MKTIELSSTFSIPAEKLYKAWLDPVHHAAMSYGGQAEFEVRVGGTHSTGDGYITGQFLELEPGRRIVETWRTSDFPEEQPDSRVELLFEDVPEGGRIQLVHQDLPEEQIEEYQKGWMEYYFQPMKLYFGG